MFSLLTLQGSKLPTNDKGMFMMFWPMPKGHLLLEATGWWTGSILELEPGDGTVTHQTKPQNTFSKQTKSTPTNPSDTLSKTPLSKPLSWTKNKNTSADLMNSTKSTKINTISTHPTTQNSLISKT
jgi:hypothetical protein